MRAYQGSRLSAVGGIASFSEHGVDKNEKGNGFPCNVIDTDVFRM